MTLQGRIFIARHGETVFNAAKRMQGDQAHTPLTRAGFAQAEAMGAGLARWLGTRQTLSLWSSTAGRALQTLAIVAEHIQEDWHEASIDDRLREIDIGIWGGRFYRDVAAQEGEILDSEHGLFTKIPEGGESYSDVAARLSSWIADTKETRGDRLVIMHGMSARVLRGLLTAAPIDPRYGAPIAGNLPQGSMVMVGGGVEKIIYLGGGGLAE